MRTEQIQKDVSNIPRLSLIFSNTAMKQFLAWSAYIFTKLSKWNRLKAFTFDVRRVNLWVNLRLTINDRQIVIKSSKKRETYGRCGTQFFDSEVFQQLFNNYSAVVIRLFLINGAHRDHKTLYKNYQKQIYRLLVFLGRLNAKCLVPFLTLVMEKCGDAEYNAYNAYIYILWNKAYLAFWIFADESSLDLHNKHI